AASPRAPLLSAAFGARRGGTCRRILSAPHPPQEEGEEGSLRVAGEGLERVSGPPAMEKRHG
ncbi:hypothetical protein, partial [Sphingomonas sp. Ant H11]|uniref:hypothetical protein n=1 Tax=Sphingomonas sp. Ant H11 TaxID=1564113 RepID=UPI001E2B8C7F